MATTSAVAIIATPCSGGLRPGVASFQEKKNGLSLYRGSVGRRSLQWQQKRKNVGVRAGTSLLTASRVGEGSAFVRIMGSGKPDVNGIGRLLVLDEFFEFPNVNGLLVPDANTLLESLIYYFDEPSPLELEDFSCSPLDLESFSGVESFRPRHGIHLYLRSNLLSMNLGQREDSQKFENGGSLVMPMITHVREASTISPINWEGGAGVRVIAGDFSGISTPPPLEDFVMLDVQVRPGSGMSIPLHPSFGVLIYVLEGVGIFEPNRFEDDMTPFYQNEGHGLYIPPSPKTSSTAVEAVRIRTHEWSHLRFILLGAPVA